MSSSSDHSHDEAIFTSGLLSSFSFHRTIVKMKKLIEFFQGQFFLSNLSFSIV